MSWNFLPYFFFPQSIDLLGAVLKANEAAQRFMDDIFLALMGLF